MICQICQAQFWMKWRWGTKKQDSPVRGVNREVGTAEESVSLRFLGWRKFSQFELLRIHL